MIMDYKTILIGLLVIEGIILLKQHVHVVHDDEEQNPPEPQQEPTEEQKQETIKEIFGGDKKE